MKVVEAATGLSSVLPRPGWVVAWMARFWWAGVGVVGFGVPPALGANVRCFRNDHLWADGRREPTETDTPDRNSGPKPTRLKTIPRPFSENRLELE